MRTTIEGQSIYCQSCQTRRRLHRVRLQHCGGETVMYLCEDCIKYVADMMGGDADGKADKTANVGR